MALAGGQASWPLPRGDTLCGASESRSLGNLSLLPPAPSQQRCRTAGHLCLSNKSRAAREGPARSAVPLSSARRAGQRRMGSPSAPGSGSGKGRPEWGPTPPRAGRRVGFAGGKASTPLCRQVPGALCTGPDLSSQFGIRANPSLFLHACPLPGARSLLGNCLLSAGSAPAPSPIKLFISL